MAKELNTIQARVLRMLANGYTVSELASAEGLSESAIQSVLLSAMRALEANTIPHATAIFYAAEMLAEMPERYVKKA